MSFEIVGRLLLKTDVVQVSEKFRKREFVIEREEGGSTKFTSYIKFNLNQDKCALIDSVNVGSELNVHFNVKGNKWEKDGKVSYFTNLDAWKIEVLNPAPEPYNPNDFVGEPQKEDDLPF